MKSKKDFFAILIFGIIIFVFFWKFFLHSLLPIPADITVGVYFPWLDYKWGYEVGVPVKNPMMSDIPSIIYPWRKAVIDSYKSFRWPLWNNSYLLGLPLLANWQSAAFSPANIFYIFFRQPIAWSLGIIGQTVVSLIFMYLFLKQKKLSILSSIAGAIIFSFNGYSVVWHQYNLHGWTQAFLPLILFLIDGFFKQNKKACLFWIPLAIALQFLSGYLPLVVLSWVIISIYFIFNKYHLSTKLILFLIFVFLGVGIASIQIFPGIEMILSSIRETDVVARSTEIKYLPIRQLVTLIAPDFYGNPATRNYSGSGFFDNFAFWVGSIPVLLTFIGFNKSGRNKENFLWGGIIFLGIIGALNTPISLLLQKIFFLEGGIAARSLFLTVFGFSVLTAYGFEIIKKVTKKEYQKIIQFSFLILGFILLNFLFVSAENFQIALRNSVISVSVLAFFILLSTTYRFFEKYSKLYEALILLLITIPLWYSSQKYWPFVREDFVFPTTPVIEFLSDKMQQNGPFRIESSNVIPHNMWMPYALESPSGYDTLMPLDQFHTLTLIRDGKISKNTARVLSFDKYDKEYFPLLNVKYFLTKKYISDGEFSPEGRVSDKFSDERYTKVFEDKTVVIFEDNNYIPRFWAADKNTLINHNRFILPNENLGEINLVKYSPNEIEINLLLDKESIVFESAYYHQGWKAYLNDQKTDILRVNHGMRGYLVPKGKHTLKVEFLPSSFVWGKVTSLISLFLWLFPCYFLVKSLE